MVSILQGLYTRHCLSSFEANSGLVKIALVRTANLHRTAKTSVLERVLAYPPSSESELHQTLHSPTHWQQLVACLQPS